MRKFPTQVSRQVHWCAEPSDSEDEADEVTVSNVQTARCRNHLNNASQGSLCSLKSNEEFENSWISSGRIKPKTRMATEPAMMLPITVNGSRVDFELDTGASVSIIDEATWQKIGKPEIKPTKLEATAYNKSPISFVGRCVVKLQFEGRVENMEVYVLRTAGHPLCGRDMIRKLKIDCGPYVKSIRREEAYTQEQLRTAIKNMLEENRVLFQKRLGCCTTTKVLLTLEQGMEKPKFCRVRPVPIALRPKVEAKLQELVENGTLTRVEHAEWATPLVVVPKPGGKIRLCGDYKVTVNPQLDINQYPLPKPDDLFHMLNGGQKFSKMDLSDAYMQLELEPESKKYTTINTHKGMFVYNRVPFGIASIPAIFQRIMETTLAGIEGVIIYLDDITVTAPDDVTHLTRLREVLKRLREAGFRLKREKCEFMKEQMEFLGHIVDAKGIRPSPKKVQAMVNMPDPKNLKELESFIGMVQYYGKFIPNLSTIAAPLNGLRRKGVPFRWEEEQRKAFQ
ncbi:reverse transcriptase [Teladorsagia circumcincta]|uniref:RNA-directed DNA polymerase n=1 Tax=Teladorsagia circumcincta TaxID=45464 RepID=A0A2G9TC45_TELCI|nr:reverse transcriptase [Teladorsagia circumcincta]